MVWTGFLNFNNIKVRKERREISEEKRDARGIKGESTQILKNGSCWDEKHGGAGYIENIEKYSAHENKYRVHTMDSKTTKNRKKKGKYTHTRMRGKNKEGNRIGEWEKL